MKIGLFTDTFYPEINGVATRCLNLQRELTRRGHEVHVYAPKCKGWEENQRENVHYLASAPLLVLKDRNFAFPTPLTSWEAEKIDFDVVHTNSEFVMGMFGHHVAGSLGCAQVHTYHTVWEDYTYYITHGVADEAARRIARKYSQWWCNRFDRVITPTGKTLDLLRKYGVEALIEKAQKDQLFLSDAMPWCGERYYLPRPFLTARTDGHTAGAERKAMKNLAYIAVEDMADYLACMRGQGLFDAGRKKQCFGVPMDSTRAAVFEGQDTLPYHVGAFRFAEDCGLYVLAGLESDDAAWLRTLMRALGLSGIGGKVSSGYGKFTVDDEIYLNEPFDEQTAWLFRALCRDAPAYLLLTTALPDEEELERTMEDASYTLTRRGGFVSSDSFAPSGQKKREQFFLTAGSVVRRRFGGALYLAARQDHPVYRFSKPLLLGVFV